MRVIRILLPTLLLAACSQPAPPAADAAAPATSPPATTATPGDDVPAAGLSPDAVNAGAEPAPDAATQAPPSGSPEASDAIDTEEGEGDARQRIEKLLGDADAYEALFNDLQRGVAANDANAVAALMRYPLLVHVGGKKRQVADAATFKREYSQIVTPEIAKAIAAQTFDGLFVNWEGAMIGKGQVWIGGKCLDKDCTRSDVKVITVQD